MAFTKENIISQLDTKGIEKTSKEGRKYTQWTPTQKFYEIWRTNKEEIKELGFSLFKDSNQEGNGWVVNLWKNKKEDNIMYVICPHCSNRINFNLT